MIGPLRFALLVSSLLAPAVPAAGQDAAPAGTAPACRPSQIALTTDAGNGRDDGASQSGTLLVLRNHSQISCSLAPFAAIAFERRGGGRLPPIAIEPKTAFSGPVVSGRRMPMGHGPVALPIAMAPAETVTAELTWVSGPAYDRSVCVDVAGVSAAVGDGAVRAPLAAHICGPDAAHISVSLTRLVHYPRAPVSGI